jgi:serine/threonine protein kinase
VILRTPHDNVSPRRPRSDVRQVPVLVDFGLAGRKVRPGCGSPYYGAPEVWDISSFGQRADPRATDVYAFCCLAFELLTGNTLFAGESLPAIFAAHLSHDSNPPGLAWMREHSRHRPLGDLLSAGLAREPGRRLSIKALRECLLDLGHDGLADVTWPIRP